MARFRAPYVEQASKPGMPLSDMRAQIALISLERQPAILALRLNGETCMLNLKNVGVDALSERGFLLHIKLKA